MNDFKVESTGSFTIVGEDGHRYRVLEITESNNPHGNGWVPSRKFLRTDGWDDVDDLGDGAYRIPKLNVMARRAEASE